MNPRQFLLVGGIVLLVLGILGFLAGPSMPDQFFLTTGENVAHVVLGIVALAAWRWLTNAEYAKWLVALVGVVALFFGVLNLILPAGTKAAFNLAGVNANLENPADTILHLIVGVWALWAAFRPMGESVRAPTVTA